MRYVVSRYCCGEVERKMVFQSRSRSRGRLWYGGEFDIRLSASGCPPFRRACSGQQSLSQRFCEQTTHLLTAVNIQEWRLWVVMLYLFRSGAIHYFNFSGFPLTPNLFRKFNLYRRFGPEQTN